MGWNRKYSETEKQFIRDNWREMSDQELSDNMERTACSVKQHRQKMRLFKNKTQWSDAEIAIIKKKYPDTLNKEIIKLLAGKELHQLHTKAYSLGLRKDEDYMAAQRRENGKRLNIDGHAHRFEPGHTPFNKGMKQKEFMSAEQIEKTKATRFEKGHTPANAKFDGAITIRHNHKERGENPYMWIRLSEGKWEVYHRHVWEKENGPIPEKHCISFRDSDTLNCAPENLECIPLAERASRNRDNEKASETMKKIWAGEQMPKPLTNYDAAMRLAGQDAELKDYLMEHRPDLVKAAKANYKLKRRIRYGSNEK